VELSTDGRFEVFETAVLVPPRGDAARATLRNVNNGLLITVPDIVVADFLEDVGVQGSSPPQPSQARSEAGLHWKQTSNPPEPAELAGNAASVRREKQVASEGETASPGVRASSTAVVTPTPRELALAQGVEIVDEDYPWPEKLADASEGWWDNRGEFHDYQADNRQSGG